MIDKLEALFQTLPGSWGYVFLFFSAYVENIFPPLPGDTFVVLGAFLVGRGQMTFFPAYLSTLAGSVLGFMTYYAVGRRWGRKWFKGRRGRFFSAEQLGRVETWFGRYGDWVLVFNRFLSGFRSVVSLTAGIARMDARKVFLFALASCVLWNGLLMGLGLWVGENWTVIIENFQRVILGVIVVALLVWWIKIRRKRNIEARKPRA
jgi:membrane protein DedA with SNARE-associated domain